MKAGTEGQARLDKALRRDMAFAKTRKHGGAQGLQSSISKEAFFNAVRTEGREVLEPQGEGYWKDMQRKYPHTNLTGYGDSGDSPNGRRCRLGNVSRRFSVARGWEVWRDGGWEKED